MEEFTYYGIVISLKKFILRNVEKQYGNKSDISIRKYISNNQYEEENNIINYPIINEGNLEEIFLNCVYHDAIFDPFGARILMDKDVIIGSYMGMNITEKEKEDLLPEHYMYMKHILFNEGYINYCPHYIIVKRIEGKDEIVYKLKL